LNIMIATLNQERPSPMTMTKTKRSLLSTAALMTGLALFSGACGGDGGGGGTPDGGGACPAAVDVVSDFSNGTTAGVNAVPPRMGGWYLYYQGDGSNTAEPANTGTTVPPKTTGGLPRDTTMGYTACSGPGSLRVQAMAITGWGVGIATNIVPDASGKHGQYNASEYAGLRAAMYCATETKHVNLKIPDGNTDFDAPSPMCASYADCVAHGSWNNTVKNEWQLIDVKFATATQNPNQTAVPPIANIDKTRLTAIQVQIDADYVSGVAQPINFDCYIDDVHFYKE
jgi:hypothetical protein